MDSTLVLPTLLEQHAANTPDKVFVTDAASDEIRTHREFVDEFHRWAGALDSVGVKSGDTVLVMMPTDISAMAAWMGIARLRAIEVPVNSQYHGDMLTYVINDSSARIMVAHVSYIDQIVEVLGDTADLKTLVVVGADENALPAVDGFEIVTTEQFLKNTSDITARPRPQGHDIAAIVYTSGTTGASKGVLMPWAQVYETALWMGPKDELNESDVAYLPFPFYHITIKAPVYLMALVGGQIIVREKISISNYWDEVYKYGVTYTILLAVMISMLLNDEPKPNDADNPLKFVGVVPRPANIADFEKRFGVQTGTIFNMTETSVPFCDHSADPQDPASCGRARPGLDVRLVDENDYPVPAGRVGELIVRSDEPWTLNAGYWRKPEATAKAWRNGWFHTGDAFREDGQGNYYFVDRFKDAIRRRGENVSSMEVEAFVRAHPAVNEVAAIGVPSPLGEEDIKIVVVRKAEGGISAEELTEYLVGRMPGFMVPRYVQFVDDLPKTPTYKIRKVELSKGVDADTTWDRQAAVKI